MKNDFLMFIRKIPVRLTHLPPQKCVQEWIQTRTTGNSTALMSSMTATLRRKSFLRIIQNILCPPKGEVSGCRFKRDGIPILYPAITSLLNVRCSVTLQNFAEKQLQQKWRQENDLVQWSR